MGETTRSRCEKLLFARRAGFGQHRTFTWGIANLNRQQEHLLRSANSLGLRIEVGYTAHLPGGEVVTSQALLPDLGARLGTLVFQEAPTAVIRAELLLQGFTSSSYMEPLPTQTFDLESYAEMFAEWGWTGDPKSRPAWIK